MRNSTPFLTFRDIESAVWANSPRTRSTQLPLDVYRTADEAVLRVDVPGATADDIELVADATTLTLTVADLGSGVPENARSLVSERTHGAMTRRVSLGNQLDTSQLQASLDNGVLTVTIPVAANAVPRKVEIRAASPAVTAGVTDDASAEESGADA